ncbi:hypothetical protein [Aquimarina sp. RZ0]|uniref:hypothetical protein n=1 Tax=Aquimarina sp. RZ0 TaxID=2607730 RepID=UPI0011F14DAA|nr:hypothetical protein [Aquimarina sp. RZ0]KAA1247985.1 hypothetical protein F0000_01835 [Aquimarina sp. RZ0]
MDILLLILLLVISILIGVLTTYFLKIKKLKFWYVVLFAWLTSLVIYLAFKPFIPEPILQDDIFIQHIYLAVLLSILEPIHHVIGFVALLVILFKRFNKKS